MAALRASVLGQRWSGGLAAAAGANLDLLPHQLEPALAVVRHGARRLLLADAVGLGKTIEAGLVLAELRERSALDRVLVLAPPGLCDQWCAELSGRFGMEPVVADAGWLRSLRPILPASVNPWSIAGIRVASLDFAKRPEVRRSIEQVTWDALVIDEAHIAAGDSERRAAAHAFASRARFVLLLTATPHSGVPRTFHALCGIGALAAPGFTTRCRDATRQPHAGGEIVPDDDPVVMFRRDRSEVAVSPARRVHLHHVNGTASELAVRRQLDDYIRMVWARRTGPDGRNARLAMIVLLKRSLSGMGPLSRSLVTRLDRLGAAPESRSVQLPLSWDGDLDDADAAPAAVLGASGLDDPSDERRLLQALAENAVLAAEHDSKRRALIRLLKRVHEPAIVFTEYRDTLTALLDTVGPDAAVLHGAMDRFERAAAIGRFNSGGVRVLLATDAAGEGLNLQHRCRLVINLELPWNPMRLEQRIGRVDRIGQSRTVHAINLLGSGTAESGLLSRLSLRLAHARRTVGAIDDVLGGSEERVMTAWLGMDSDSGGIAVQHRSAGRGFIPRSVRRVDLGGAAREVAAHLTVQRQLLRASGIGKHSAATGRSVRRSAGILVTAVRRSRFPVTHGRSGLLAVFRVRSAAPAGLAPSEELVAVFAECPCPRFSRRRHIRARASTAKATLVPRLAAAIRQRDAQPEQGGQELDRDARLAAGARARRAVQRGLFDRRAEREAEQVEVEAAGQSGQTADRRAPGGNIEDVTAGQAPQPVLLLFVTS
jgi:superfamily II DNA or RNA helicase